GAGRRPPLVRPAPACAHRPRSRDHGHGGEGRSAMKARRGPCWHDVTAAGGHRSMTPTTIDIDDLVSLDRGEVDRRTYSDRAIFDREMEQIFGRAWLFLCHESQIPEPGDFFASVMGRDNVLVVRQKDGGIRAMLNTCAHRGNAVCRADEGNAKGFLCTYHGWSYGIDGRLVGVPGYKSFYAGEADN